MLGLIIGSLFFGLILGPLARLVLPGRQPIGIAWTIGAGFLGALIGGLLASALGLADNEDNIDWVRILIQLVCAVIAVAAVAASKTGRSSRV
ncbi:MAG: GlsB/YeaQ/YmgE family stress response membrane protein [Propionibacteriales bacterium]|nr:GlsB/YeaQ/YmgE family stress response membrane protein [Propionibacteriales bacterium]